MNKTPLKLSNTDDPLAFAAAIEGACSVQLQFPKFSDGRAFSQAALLRERMGYAGEIHATGDVLVDQLLQMQRCGFSHATLRADQDLAVGQKLLAQYEGIGFYQTDPGKNAGSLKALVLSKAEPAYTRATLLYAHGSRDEAWIGTIERMAHELQASDPMAHHVSTAYVEHAEPTLAARVAQVLAFGVRAVRIYPLFLGAGHHVKHDVIVGIDALKAKYSHIDFECMPILGEDSAFIAFLAEQLKTKPHGSRVTVD